MYILYCIAVFTVGFVMAVSSCTYTINLYKLADGYGGKFGAAILGAKSAGLKLNVDYDKSRSLFDSISKY